MLKENQGSQLGSVIARWFRRKRKEPSRSAPSEPENMHPKSPEGPVDIPEVVPILPLQNSVLFPGAIIPIEFGRPKSIKLIEDAITREQPIIGVLTQLDAQIQDPGPQDFYRVGCAARILKVTKLAGGNVSVIVQGVARICVLTYQREQSQVYLMARIKGFPDPAWENWQSQGLAEPTIKLRDTTKQVIRRMPDLPREALALVESIQEPSQLSDCITSQSNISIAEKQDILETFDIRVRTDKVLKLMTRQLKILDEREKTNPQVQSGIDPPQQEIPNKFHSPIKSEKELLMQYAAGRRDFQRIDLSSLSLSGQILAGANFSAANLSGTRFCNMVLVGSNFSDAQLGPEFKWPPLHFGAAVILTLLASAGAALAGTFLGLLISGPAQQIIGYWSGPLAMTISATCMAAFLLRGYSAIVQILVLTLFIFMWAMVFVFTNHTIYNGVSSISSVLQVAGSLGTTVIATSVFVLAMMCVSLLYVGSVFILGRPAALLSLIGLVLIFIYLWRAMNAANGLSVVIGVGVMLMAIYVSERALAHDPRFELARVLGVQLGCIGGTSFENSDLTGADFSRVFIGSTNFSGACLSQTCFLGASQLTFAEFGQQPMSLKKVQAIAAGQDTEDRLFDRLDLSRLFLCGCDLSGTSFRGTNLQQALLRETKLQKGQLQCANLREVDLRDADLTGAALDSADLRGACLAGANLSNTTWRGAQVDVITYSRSGWDAGRVAELHRAGTEFVALDMFPQEVQAAVLGAEDGMTIYFCKQLAPLDRFVIDGTIFGVLGKDTDCHVVEFRERGAINSVRLSARKRQDLERVAEALYLRVWENLQQKRVEETALLMNTNLLGPGARETLSALRTRIERVELQIQKQPAWRWDFGQDRVSFDRTVRLYLSYAAEDEQYCQQLEGHLAILKRQGIIQTWHSGLLQAGSHISTEQQRQLDEADVVVLLVSADYLRSDGLYAQLDRALRRQASDEIQVVPVLVRTVGLAGCPLEHLRCLPSGRPISKWDDKDDAWASVANSIRMIVLGMVGAAGSE